jgi:Ca2+-binding EF-hand superfamily protein
MSSSISGVSGGFNAASLKQMQEQMFKAVDSNGDNKIDKSEMSAFQKTQQDSGSQGGPSVDEMFKKLDSNSDGAISRLESDAALAKMSQQMQSQPPPQASGGSESNSSADLKNNVFKSADQNGDGSISKDELTKLLGNSQSDTTADQIMSALDTNKDGSISKSESDSAVDKAGQQRRAQGPPPPPPPKENSTSSSDSSSSSTTVFDALDTNKDGTVSASELLAAFTNDNSSSSDSNSSTSSSSATQEAKVKKIFDAMDTNKDGSVSKSELEAALAKSGKESSSTASSTDTTKPGDSSLFAAAAKSYMQASFSSFAQNAAASALSSSALYA